MSTRTGPSRKPDQRWFVEVARRPSLGVEVTSGRAWVGVDQQVGHGSADALYALTDEQYRTGLAEPDALRPFLGECWSGHHPDRLLFSPGGGRWRPERWSPWAERTVPPRVAGEIWCHLDALGTAVDDDAVARSRALAGGTARAVERDGVHVGVELDLTGGAAHPRAGALVVGLAAGSDRARVAAILGDPVDDGPDVHRLEGDRLTARYDDGGGLVGLRLSRPTPPTAPVGAIGVMLHALGQDEGSAPLEALIALLGEPRRRWTDSLLGSRRMIELAGGVEVLLDDRRVTEVRTPALHPDEGRPALLPGLTRPPSREEVAGALGHPVMTTADLDLFRSPVGDVVVGYGALGTAVAPRSVSVRARGGHAVPDRRWRVSGDLVTFVDTLGRDRDHPLVDRVRALPEVRVGFRANQVDEIELGGRHGGHRFAAAVDGLPSQPTRADLRALRQGLAPARSDPQRVEQRPVDGGVWTVRYDDADRVTSMVVSRD
ncbi:hypothetical protein AWH69_11130 [Janibacter melonis]|uniref:Uncharacterized protein n=1 Tax=Janibacter melonis TaxID=262209 RepID=A0A176QB79_9MICO|nr:hypothetical protein AWH69_11130 [Janibacter melonis]